MTKENFEAFKLNKNESEILLAIQKLIIQENISSTSDEKLILFKEAWALEWDKMIYDSLKGAKTFNKLDETEITDKLLILDDHLKTKIILLESAIFTPYYNLNKRGLNINELKNEYKKEKDHTFLYETVEKICKKIKINKSEIEDALRSYQTAIDKIPSKNIAGRIAIVLGAAIALGVTGGWAAPAIGSLIGGIMGLSGAAATSAGLAFLGGGALAAGGFGMAGGTTLIIGGGGLIGAVLGSGLNSQFLENDDLVLSQLAKLESIVHIFYKKNSNMILRIIENHRAIIDKISVETKEIENHISKIDLKINKLNEEKNSINKQIKELKKEKEESGKRAKRILKSSEYCENAVTRLKELI